MPGPSVTHDPSFSGFRMTQSKTLPTATSLRLAGLALMLAAGPIGCYRAAGVPKNTPIAYEMPESGGDRVAGLKATGGPGDFYLGNDYVAMAVDGAAYGERKGQLGAPSGGAILDVGSVGLDNAYKRVALPADNLERFAPVANQDPELPLIFDSYQASSTGAGASLEMRGGLLDPANKLGLPGSLRDANGRILGVEVVHTITLSGAAFSFDLSTTLVNRTGQALPIYSLGDYLQQRGGGLRALVPAQTTSGLNPSGSWAGPAPVTSWGAAIPGSDFSTTTGGVEDPAKRFNPLATAVKAYGLGLQGAEPSAETFDFHQSLGIASLDDPYVLVSADPQDAMNELRPRFPARVVVGKVPRLDAATRASLQPASLADGATLSYARRLYATAAPTTGISPRANRYYPLLSQQATEVFDRMADDRALRFGDAIGHLNFFTFGTAVRGGALPTEVKFERFQPAGSSGTWVVEGVDWFDGGELHASPIHRPVALYSPDGKESSTALNPTQPYRITLSNRLTTQSFGWDPGTGLPKAELRNASPDRVTSLPTKVVPTTGYGFVVSEALAPEVGPGIVDANWNVIGASMVQHLMGVSALDKDPLVIQPARVRVEALDGAGNPAPANDPKLQRTRAYFGAYDTLTKGKVRGLGNAGVYQFRGGNELFGTVFNFAAALQPISLAPGKFRALAGRGPLAPLAAESFTSALGQGAPLHSFRIPTLGLPSGWVSFDLPGPSQATTGGMVPAEMLTSALAEHVEVVARTEEDRLVSASGLYNDFRLEFSEALTSAESRAVIGLEPFVVGGRSSELAGHGRATALFTPEPTGARFGGARESRGWTLADFIANGDGSFTVVHHPRFAGNAKAPAGLFAAKAYDRTVALGTGVNAWWNQTSPISAGKKQGDFDALELIRAEYSDANGPLDLAVAANATAWFSEFLAVRADWLAILKQQGPAAFTKGLGLSAGKYSLDTPVGLARTYLQVASAPVQTELSPVSDALKAGRAVASTGPFLDVKVGSQGPGGFLTGTNATAPLSLSVYVPDWVPVDEVRVVVNGTVVSTIPFNATNFTRDTYDKRKWVLTNAAFTTLSFSQDSFVVVEAGVPLSTTGAYAAGFPWARFMKGIYPIAVANPVFVDVNGGGYTAPGLP